jgi:hypothetical protein
MGMGCLANHIEVLESTLQMPNSDFSDLSDSDLDGSPPVSLDCAECKKKFTSTDRGCDTDERTCSTCTKQAHKALMKAFMIEPGLEKSSTTAAVSAVTSNQTIKEGGNDAGACEDAEVNSANQKGPSNKENGAASTIVQGDKTFSTPSIQGAERPTSNDNTQHDIDNDGDVSDEGRHRGSESSGSELSEDEGHKVAKKKGKRKGKRTVGNYDGDVDDLLVDEVSIECMCGGRMRTLCRKMFRMDAGTTIRLFCDLELLDELPLLYSYFILSAHVNATLKRSVRGMRVVEDQNGKKWVILCVFRSKCPNPRYDVIILDPAETDPAKAVMRICGLTNFFKWYKYVPDEIFDNKYAIRILKEYLENKFDDKGRSLVYDKTKGPNKDEMGRPMTEGYDPLHPVSLEKDGFTPSASKRVSNKPAGSYADEQGEESQWVRKRQPYRRKSPASANKKQTPGKQKVSALIYTKCMHRLIIMMHGSDCRL